jgi:diguanylate cyclase (GGDEF)-like protein
MTSASTRQRVVGCYLAGALAASFAHPFLPEDVRPAWFMIVEASAIGPTLVPLLRSPRGSRTPWWLLLLAMILLIIGNGGYLTFRVIPVGLGDTILAAGHACLLAAAVAVVVRRGRKDMGGMIDVSIVAMGLGGLLWTGMLQPRLLTMQTPMSGQASLLVSTFVLAGLLGAMSRLWRICPQRLVSLELWIVALMLALVGNVALAMAQGVLTLHRPPWAEVLFLLAYSCVGAAALHPSALELMQPGPAPVDHLGPTRLAFLGTAVALSPVIAGLRQLLDLPTDALLVTGGTVALVPLVMVRIGALAAQRRDAEVALIRQATTDTLTGLPNRAEFHTRLDRALSDRAGAGIAVLFCDLNGFKDVNDRLGHRAGDELLVMIGARLAGSLRAGDTVGRYGGDEFLAFCPDTTREEVLSVICPRLREAIAAPVQLAGGSVTVGASVGIVFADGETDPDALIGRADAAMYRAKQGHDREGPLAVAFA